MANATASAFLHNLDCLGFRPSLHAKGAFANISFTADIFTRLADNNKAFEATSHFLFEKLNPARARTHFRHCWPIIHYTSQSRLYRLAAFHWLQELKRQNHLPAHILLRRSYLEDCHGQHMNDLMLAFSNYVLKAVQERKKAHTTFVPSIDASGTGDKDTGIKQTTIPSSAKDVRLRAVTSDNREAEALPSSATASDDMGSKKSPLLVEELNQPCSPESPPFHVPSSPLASSTKYTAPLSPFQADNGSPLQLPSSSSRRNGDDHSSWSHSTTSTTCTSSSRRISIELFSPRRAAQLIDVSKFSRAVEQAKIQGVYHCDEQDRALSNPSSTLITLSDDQDPTQDIIADVSSSHSPDKSYAIDDRSLVLATHNKTPAQKRYLSEEASPLRSEKKRIRHEEFMEARRSEVDHVLEIPSIQASPSSIDDIYAFCHDIVEQVAHDLQHNRTPVNRPYQYHPLKYPMNRYQELPTKHDPSPPPATNKSSTISSAYDPIDQFFLAE